MKKSVCLTSFVCMMMYFVSAVAADNELFPFVISFDAPKNATNISHQLDAPAGKNGFVRVQDGHFVTDKGRIQFWGTNTCFAANFLDHAAADRMADRMARFGINCVRLHHMDSHDIWGGSNAKTKLEFDKAQLDKLDYYIAALKKRGIYVNINLHVSRSLDERDGFPKDVNRPSHDKGIDNYYRPFIDANKKYARDLLTHVNPYTGNAYKDEPSVAMIEINNENSIVTMWGGWGGLDVIQDPFLSDLRQLWNNWLKTKYKNDTELRNAWNCRSVPFGQELLKNADFANNYVPDGKGWNWETDEVVDAPVSNTGGVLRLDVRKKGKVDWHPQLIASGFSVQKNQLYTLEFKIKANRAATLNVGLRMNHEPWEGLGFDTQINVTTDWQTIKFITTPPIDDSNARISIGGLSAGTVYEIDSVSFKPGGEIGLPKEPLFGNELLENGDFKKDYVPNGKGWNWEVDAKVDASVSNIDGVLRLDVRKKGEVDWHPQLSGGSFAVEKKQKYTLVFTAKANKPAPLNIGLRMAHEPWQGLSFDEHEELTTDWKTFRYTVSPDQNDDKARIVFGGFQEGIVYEIDSVSFKSGEAGVEKEASLAAGSIPVIWKKDAGKYMKEAVDDFCDFLFDIEAKYWDEMYRFLKDDIKVKQPVTGTQLEYGSTHAQAKMDYCDIHAYWNHPHFPGRAWDGNNWYLRNIALVNYLDKQILPNLATKRVYGKPFTVSEYNHPYPNQYAAEGLPLLAAFGAFQGWDGIFPFAYSHSNNPEPKKATSFFDTTGNTVQMAHMIACHALFCNGYNKNADKKIIVAPLTVEKERELFKQDRHQYRFGFSGLGLDSRNALINPVAVDVSGKVKELPKLPEIPKEQKKFDYPASGQGTTLIQYDMQQQGKGFVSVINQGASLFTGFVTEGKEYPFFVGTIQFGKTNLGWSTVSATTLSATKYSEKFLLVATGEMTNTGMKLESLGDDKVTVGNRWGSEPVLCEGISAQILFKSSVRKTVKFWSLDESGNRKQELPVKKTDNNFTLELKPEYKTIWYEIEVLP
ncbi:MAG: carbohydrate binding domain-containing protein [Planctomycetaceae bacterium]|nr:carbohydrate binding domain-containing protein [Planctomycetaceae bacterium]